MAARRKSAKKTKGSFAVKAVIGGVCVCVVAAIIGFASTKIYAPSEVSLGLGSSSSFQALASSSSSAGSNSGISISDSVALGSEATSTTSSSADDSSSASSGESSSSAASSAASGTASGTSAGSASGASSGASGASGSSSFASGASSTASSSGTTDVFANSLTQRSILNDLTPLNVSADLKTLSDRIEQRKRAEEEAARQAELAHIQEVQEKQRAWGGESAVSAIDFSVGEEAFVEEWTERIDAYLAGSNLAGHGCDFAQAAWDYGVDPRWSPAISNTESGKGSNCFLPYNAWGWGTSIWFNWTDAIYGHVKGLSDGYGYSITYSAAASYCPPNTDNWYKNTLGEMEKI